MRDVEIRGVRYRHPSLAHRCKVFQGPCLDLITLFQLRSARDEAYRLVFAAEVICDGRYLMLSGALWCSSAGQTYGTHVHMRHQTRFLGCQLLYMLTHATALWLTRGLNLLLSPEISAFISTPPAAAVNCTHDVFIMFENGPNRR